MTNLKSIVISAFAVPLTLLAVPIAAADVLLSYTGNDFTFATPPYTTNDFISVSLVLSSPLVPGSNIVTPLSYSVSDGVDTISSPCSICSNFFSFDISPASGDLVLWNVIVFNGTERIETRIQSGALDQVQVNGNIVAESTTAGTWIESTVVPIPEPTTLALFAIGLAGLVFAVRKPH